VLVNISISDMWSARYVSRSMKPTRRSNANVRKLSRHVLGDDWPCLGSCCRTWTTARRRIYRVPFVALDFLDQPSLLLRCFCCPLFRPRCHQCKSFQRRKILTNGLDRNCRDHKHDGPRAAESGLRRRSLSLEFAQGHRYPSVGSRYVGSVCAVGNEGSKRSIDSLPIIEQHLQSQPSACVLYTWDGMLPISCQHLR
jgi:hypothetical protein